jgi:UDP-N-acetylglucosamine diphosphorylase/glucosamine-1-phosphate N-acetyltransferase
MRNDKMKAIVLFEDSGYINLLPLVYFRPTWEIRCGALTLREKLQKYFSKNVYYSAREYLMNYSIPENQSYSKISDSEEILFINGRWILEDGNVKVIQNLPLNTALVKDEFVLAFCCTREEIMNCIKNGLLNEDHVFQTFSILEHEGRLVNYLWDAVEWNGGEILRDFEKNTQGGRILGSVSSGVHIISEKDVFIGKGAKINPGVVIDASEGPVWIDEGVVVMPNAVLEGPVYIGKNSRIKIGAKIYGSTSIGPLCKMGGEIEGSIIQSYSNKQHDGFLGHAYLGSWVNLGADTNNSDLKNNYGMIKVILNGRELNTQKRFVGLMMGDHSKSAINTMFNTGSIVGVNCNIFGAGMPPKFVPSFSWCGSGKITEYRLDKAMEVAKIVMERRDIPFNEKEENLFREIKKQADQIEVKHEN